MRGSRAVRKHFKRSSLIRRLFPICLNSHHGAEAYRLEAGHGLVGRQEVQEGLGSIGIGAVFHDGGGVDHLAAHLSGGLVHHGQTGGEGVDMTFEQVAVTEGDTNDYYVEITGSDLNEGDVIRATADLTQGIESGTSDSDVQMMENGDLYVGDGSNMPEGAVVMGGPGGGPGGPGGQ